MNWTKRVAGWAVVGLGLGLGGCDSGDDSPEPTAKNLRADELDARCEYLVRCAFYPDRDTCVRSEAPDTGLLQALGGQAFGRVDYNIPAVEAYIDTLRNLSCDNSVANYRALFDARAEAFSGQVEIGGDCFADEECMGAAICDANACPNNLLCCTGTCVEFRTLAIGDTCQLTTDGPRIASRCGDDAYCQPPPDDGTGEPPASGVCALRATNGDPCEHIDGCGDGMRCDINGSNTCYKLSGAGEMCNPMLGQGSCIGINDACDPASSTCKTAPGPGQACPARRCVDYAFCDDTDTCIARPQLGEACDGNNCLGDLFCRDNTCQRPETVHVCIDGQDPPPEMP